jgi:hypothetical protein
MPSAIGTGRFFYYATSTSDFNRETRSHAFLCAVNALNRRHGKNNNYRAYFWFAPRHIFYRASKLEHVFMRVSVYGFCFFKII